MDTQDLKPLPSWIHPKCSNNCFRVKAVLVVVTPTKQTVSKQSREGTQKAVCLTLLDSESLGVLKESFLTHKYSLALCSQRIGCQNIIFHPRNVPGSVAVARSQFPSAKPTLAGPDFVWHIQVQPVTTRILPSDPHTVLWTEASAH